MGRERAFCVHIRAGVLIQASASEKEGSLVIGSKLCLVGASENQAGADSSLNVGGIWFAKQGNIEETRAVERGSQP